ncbi:hypothetical protein AB0J80_22495 [Actinoplanes sp. NPDC049548]|uniref:hypothetical protein n=1 Tax=Actinoplanes sp. NPDC049548 TaxID=3155152 RepID=UPI00342D4667
MGVDCRGGQAESAGVPAGGEVGAPGDDFALDDGREPVVAVRVVEVVAELGQVQGDLVGDLVGADAADGGIEVAAGLRLARVRGGETADRQRHNLS